MSKKKKIDESVVKEGEEVVAPAAKSKTEAIASMISALSILPADKRDELVANFAKTVEESAEMVGEDKELDAKAAIKEAVEADLVEAFGDENMPAEMRTKLSTLFESALSARLNIEVEALNEHYENRVQEEVSNQMSELVERLNDYVSLAAETWVAENEVAIESTLRTEIAESVLENLRGVLLAHNMDVPEGKEDILEQYEARIAALENDLNEAIEDNIRLTKDLSESRTRQIVDEMTEDLNTFEASKFRTLLEDVSFETEEELLQKGAVLKEKYFPKSKPVTTTLLTEQMDEIDVPEQKVVTGDINQYIKAMARLSKK